MGSRKHRASVRNAVHTDRMLWMGEVVVHVMDVVMGVSGMEG